MRRCHLYALIIVTVLCFTLVGCSPEPKDVPTSGSKPSTYTTASTAIGTLLNDPKAKAVLEKHLPEIVNSSRIALMKNATLKSIQGYGSTVLTDEVLAAVDADLAKLKPTLSSIADAFQVVNVDESRVEPFTLPDPLRLIDGQTVTDADTWWNKRRPQILYLYETLVYGRVPEEIAPIRFDIIEKAQAFEGKALRKQVRIYLADDPSAPSIHLVEYLPINAEQPPPMLLMISFTAPSAMFSDPDIIEGMVWDPQTGEKIPAMQIPESADFSVEKFLDAGFAVASYYYGDVDPDFADGYSKGIRAHYDKDKTARPVDSWGAISAWAWSLSRVQDYLETDTDVDSDRVAIFGASRLGKTALWAAAQDQRFAAVIACCSGKLGAALMRRNYGEPINGVNGGSSDYWVAPNLRDFYRNEDKLPVDSHMLLSLIAPRPVLLQTGRLDHAADPKGEFLAEVAASPVYHLLGGDDLGTETWPPEAPILNDLGYYMHDGGHGMSPGDWDIYLAFLKKHLLVEK